MLYKGSCHCGKIAFQVEGEIKNATACNCSICTKKGWLLWFVPFDNMQLLTPEQEISSYTFNQHLIKHRFCDTCGIHPYGVRLDSKGNRLAGINLRCLDGLDLESVPVQYFDGRAL